MNNIKFNQSKLINRPKSVIPFGNRLSSTIPRKTDETEKEVKKRNKYQK